MPELPEVETIVSDLRPKVEGRTLRYPKFHRSDVLRGISVRRAIGLLTNQRVSRITRRAKHAVFHLGNDYRLVVQPGMTGALLLHTWPLSAEQRRYAVWRARLSDDEALVYRDVRRLGRIYLLDPKGWDEYDQRLGPEPLERGFTARDFGDRVRRSRQAIKKLIMDQSVVVGVGNIYANEALFRSGISPARRGMDLTPEDVARLRVEIRRVLRRAIASRGTTFRDYRTGTGQRGQYQAALEVYGRGGESCVKCGSTLVTTHAIDGRSSTYCQICQRA